MRIHRFYSDQTPLEEHSTLFISDPLLIRQISGVLRLTTGEKIIVFNGDGYDYTVDLVEVKKSGITGIITHKEKNNREPLNTVTLFLAILKKENFELVVQKATECGVTRIVPLLTTRTVKQSLHRERLQIIAKEAAEQSGRACIPEIDQPLSFESALTQFPLFDEIFFFDTNSTTSPLLNNDSNNKALFVGPEGGFTKEECAQALAQGAKLASLGKRTLRAETAAIVATYLFTK
jgi:16S rRNA (uracil1498-N3)-methyltransferase